MSSAKRITDTSYFGFLSERDPRTKDYILANGYLIAFIVSTYLLLVLRILPNFMKSRKAYELNKLMILYNGIQVLVNAHIFYELIPYIIKSNFVCEEVNPEDFSKETIHGINVGYIYFITKVVDLLDTVFFILRKKQNQVTVLHVYHHAIMIAMGWTALIYVPGGHTAYTIFLNSFVHVVMYFYYALSALDEKYRRSIWWKKHITHLQIVQFVTGLIINMGPVVSKDCKYNKPLMIMYNCGGSAMLILFINFYYKTYIVKKKK